jgi:hypothetical protein
MRALLVSATLAASVAVATATAAGDVTVWSGVREHVVWSLAATDGPHGSFCITMRNEQRLDASECGSIFESPSHGVSYLAHFGRPGPNYVVGPVVATASRVTVSLSNGTSLTIPTIPPPSGLARNIRFYVRVIPCRAVAVRGILGTNAAGYTVASLQIPSFGSRATC